MTKGDADQAQQRDTGAGPDTSRYLDYLTTNRDFTAPAVQAAIASIETTAPRRTLRILDAGTGIGAALPYLAELAGPASRAAGGAVIGVDLDERAVEAARASIAPRWRGVVDVRVADLREVAVEAAATGDTFDVIWSSDVVWPATFDDPAAVVRTLAGAVAPDGVLALFTTNYYQSSFLPGHARLERFIRTASELTWGLPGDGPTQHECLGAWLRQAGLEDITLRVFPVVASTRTEPAARAFLEQIVWPEMSHAVAAHGGAAWMSDADITRAEELLDPADPSWVGADPNGYVVQPTLLWTGRATDGGPR